MNNDLHDRRKWNHPTSQAFLKSAFSLSKNRSIQSVKEIEKLTNERKVWVNKLMIHKISRNAFPLTVDLVYKMNDDVTVQVVEIGKSVQYLLSLRFHLNSNSLYYKRACNRKFTALKFSHEVEKRVKNLSMFHWACPCYAYQEPHFTVLSFFSKRYVVIERDLCGHRDKYWEGLPFFRVPNKVFGIYESFFASCERKLTKPFIKKRL